MQALSSTPFKLPGGMFGKMISPATVLGELTPDLRPQTGMAGLKVSHCGARHIRCRGGVGAKGDNWAFLSWDMEILARWCQAR